jgi:hypothetical protein
MHPNVIIPPIHKEIPSNKSFPDKKQEKVALQI